LLRPITIWPFPEERIRELARKAKAFIVPEINYGQIVFEVERCAGSKARTVLVPNMGGSVHKPETIFEVIREATSSKNGNRNT
jgi:2-oxoglutarate ferredoxin oxidoreductase subunit alpha